MSAAGDAAQARDLMLDGVASGRDFDELHADLGAVHYQRSSFPGRPLLDLAADAFLVIGSTAIIHSSSPPSQSTSLRSGYRKAARRVRSIGTP